MKSRIDIAPQSVLIGLGLILGFPFYRILYSNFSLSTGGTVIFFLLCIFPILFGLWKIEQISIVDKVLIKTNFMGLVKRKRDLNTLVHVKKKYVDNDVPSNLFKILPTKNEKYVKFRILTLRFEAGRKIRINEIFMPREDFSQLFNILRRYEKKG